jgi:hypothetical protein
MEDSAMPDMGLMNPVLQNASLVIAFYEFVI